MPNVPYSYVNWQVGHKKWFLKTNLFLITPFLITKFDCIDNNKLIIWITVNRPAICLCSSLPRRTHPTGESSFSLAGMAEPRGSGGFIITSNFLSLPSACRTSRASKNQDYHTWGSLTEMGTLTNVMANMFLIFDDFLANF